MHCHGYFRFKRAYASPYPSILHREGFLLLCHKGRSLRLTNSQSIENIQTLVEESVCCSPYRYFANALILYFQDLYGIRSIPKVSTRMSFTHCRTRSARFLWLAAGSRSCCHAKVELRCRI